MTQAFIAIGSNIEPEKNIRRAVEALSGLGELEEVSTFFITRPIGAPPCPAFVNGMVRMKTDLDPHALKEGLLRIESRLGRIRMPDRFAPRTIDLDISLFGSDVVHVDRMQIPDPDIFERYYLAATLMELAGDILIPGDRGRLSDVLRALPPEDLIELTEFTEELKKAALYGSDKNRRTG